VTIGSSTSRAAGAPLFLALGAVGFLSSPALAADTVAADGAVQSNVERNEQSILVTGQRAQELESPKQTAPLVDTPQTITVLDSETIRQQNLLTLRDALSTLPGITFGAGEGGGGFGDKINLRGYTADNDITVDGVRDSAQYSRSDPFNLEQIEVYNGANSVFSGSGSVGGTINLVSKVPQRRTATLLTAGIGTDNYWRAAIDTNVRVSELIAVRLNAMYHRNDIPGRDVERNRRWGVAPSITIGVDSPTRLTLAYVHQHDDNIPVYGVPYYASVGGPLPGIDDSSYFGIENLDRQRITVDRLTATFEHAISDRISIRNLTRWQRVAQPSRTSAPQSATNGTGWCLPSGLDALGNPCATPGFYTPSGPRGLVRDQLNQLLYNQTDLTWESGEAGALHNTLVAGGSYTREDYRIETAQLLRDALGNAIPQPPIAITDPTDTVWTGPINRTLTGISYGRTRNLAGYVFDNLEIGPMFEINAGVRYENVRNYFRADAYDIPANGSSYTRGVDQVNEDNLFSYRAGLVFHPIPTASVYASFANSRTPSSDSVRAGCINARSGEDSCDVAPETARSYEIGAKIDLLDRHLQLTAALFRNERSNYKVPSNDPVNPTLQVLDGRARVDGIALGITGNITRHWSIFANYTYLDSSVRQSVSDFCLASPGSAGCANSVAVPDPARGDRLVQTPRHSGSLFTTYQLPFGLQVGYGVTYQGKVALNQSLLSTPVQFKSDDYWVQRLFFAYEIRHGLTAQLNIQNLTNERYFTSIRSNVSASGISGGWAAPGESRSVVFSLNVAL
jgi:catecholate siderophore receptor